MNGKNKWLYAGFALAVWVLTAAAPGRTWPGTTPETVPGFVVDSLKTDPETGLALDDQFLLVKGQCTVCHSSQLILQSHFSREKWVERIRWMQRTQKLWDLGESEPAILTYLTKHYGPLRSTFDGRRGPLQNLRWHKLD